MSSVVVPPGIWLSLYVRCERIGEAILCAKLSLFPLSPPLALPKKYSGYILVRNLCRGYHVITPFIPLLMGKVVFDYPASELVPIGKHSHPALLCGEEGELLSLSTKYNMKISPFQRLQGTSLRITRFRSRRNMK